ncbi:ABC transporter G family member 11 [Platanthera guangdongensis]|uniref:ABC transporter G family member 11 n=1 Tax=Platanthera guangdongensis TaxID=2320717 RepID=A0ABR2LHF2_9ASPA
MEFLRWALTNDNFTPIFMIVTTVPKGASVLSCNLRDRFSMLSYISRYLTFMAIDLQAGEAKLALWHDRVHTFELDLLIALPPPDLCCSRCQLLTGLQMHPQHFAFFALIIHSSTIIVECLTMIVATIIPDFLMGIITGASIQGWMIPASGFFQLPTTCPSQCGYIHLTISPSKDMLIQGLYKNEFIGLTFPDSTVGTTITSIEILRDRWQIQEGYSKWVDLLILFGMGILYRLLFWAVIRIGEGLIAMKSIKQKHNRIMAISSLKTVEISA